MPRLSLLPGGLLLLLLLVACGLVRTAPASSFEERTQVVALDSGVTATIVAPARLDRGRPIELILYALPNGNSTAETIGQKPTPGMGWRFDIQHIGAQTRALRTRGLDQAVVVYLEADTKSWPEWRRKRGYDQANARIVAMVNRLRSMVGDSTHMPVSLTGHSGGGSFMFGFIEGQAALPVWLERIAFLDAIYNFDARHGDKLLAWLNQSPRHTLVSLAYDDREIMLDGKKVVSDSGGTWRATQRLLDFLSGRVTLTTDKLGEFDRYQSAQIEILRHPNPQNRILHTEMIGEMNGYMHAMLVRRPDYERGPTVLRSERAYVPWLDDRPAVAGDSTSHTP